MHARSIQDSAVSQFRVDFACYQRAFNLLWRCAEFHGFQSLAYVGTPLSAALAEYAASHPSMVLRSLASIADDRRTLYHISRDTLHAIRASQG